MIVDTHCHVSSVWYEPAETLLFQMDRCGVERAVLVQMLGQFDNRYQQACAARWPDRFWSVVAVDPAQADALESLRALAGEGARGVRLRPGARSPGDDPLAIWKATEALDLAVSCVGTTAQFTAPEFAELLTGHPRIPVVLEHLGGIARPDADDSAARVGELARFPNVFLKVPGLGQLAKKTNPLPSAGSPFEAGGDSRILRAVLDFSASRLMWGSDFPVVSTREGYANALDGVRESLLNLHEAELAEVLGSCALRVFQ